MTKNLEKIERVLQTVRIRHTVLSLQIAFKIKHVCMGRPLSLQLFIYKTKSRGVT